MIVITGTLPTHAEKRDDAIAAMVTMQEASLAEAGCHKYQFGFSSQDPALGMIFEEWTDQAALDAHFASPHMAEFQAALREVVSGPGSFTKYEVSSSGPLRP
jgi:quinol monooxygenase YgiN